MTQELRYLKTQIIFPVGKGCTSTCCHTLGKGRLLSGTYYYIIFSFKPSLRAKHAIYKNSRSPLLPFSPASWLHWCKVFVNEISHSWGKRTAWLIKQHFHKIVSNLCLINYINLSVLYTGLQTTIILFQDKLHCCNTHGSHSCSGTKRNSIYFCILVSNF